MSEQENLVTTILLPQELRRAVEAEAEQKQVSMAAVVRWALIDRYGAQIAAERLQAEEQQAQAEA